MKKYFLACLLLLLLSSILSCNKKKRVETAIMECIYNLYYDKGEGFKKSIEQYEKILISEKLLKDSFPKSYMATIRKMATDRSFDYHPSMSFLDYAKVRDSSHITTNDCNKINLVESSEFDTKKLSRFQHVIDSILKSDYSEPDAIAKGILSVLSEEDFEMNYYKLRIFLLLTTIRTDIYKD